MKWRGVGVAVRPDDEPLMVDFHHQLSDASVYMRFFLPLKLDFRVSHQRLFTKCFIDYDREIGLVAEYADEHGTRRIAGIARLIRKHSDNSAEVAFLVADKFQNRGLGTHLLSEIAAREQVVAAQASAGYYTLGSRDQLQHGFIMGSDPAGQKLSVSELASPVKIGGAVQEDLALLGEYVSGSRILSFHNQHGLTNLRILVGLGQEFRFQTQ